MCSQLHCDLPARPHAAPVHSSVSASCNGSAAHAENRVSGGAAWHGDADAAAGGSANGSDSSANGSNSSANGSRAGAGTRVDDGAAGADLGSAEAVGMGCTGGAGGAGSAQWFAGGGNCLLARQGPLLVEYDAAMRAPIGVVFIGIGALPAAFSSAEHVKRRKIAWIRTFCSCWSRIANACRKQKWHNFSHATANQTSFAPLAMLRMLSSWVFAPPLLAPPPSAAAACHGQASKHGLICICIGARPPRPQ